MELSINELLAGLDSFLQEQQLALFHAEVDENRPALRGPLFAKYPALTNVETLIRVRELSVSSRSDDLKKQRFTVLYRYLLELHLQQAGAPGADAIDAACRDKSFTAAAKTLTIRDALHLLPRELEQQSRDAISREVDLQLQMLLSLWQRQSDTISEAIGALKFDSPTAAVNEILPLNREKSLHACRTMLSESDAAYVDLLAFTLKKVDSTLKPSHARWADLQRATSAPWVNEFFKREDLQLAVVRSIEEMGVAPYAQGRISADNRPGNRLAQSGAFAVSVPAELRLVMVPEAGLASVAAMLNAWGRAIFLANLEPGMLLVDRRLGDVRLPLSMGTLFESVLMDEGWLKRYLRIPSATAREAARVFAFRQLTSWRTEAAHFLAADAALKMGATASALEAYTTELHAALKVEVPGALALLAQPTDLSATRMLGAAALETDLHQRLQHRFNEDWWRNPSAGQWLLAKESTARQHGELEQKSHAEGETLDVMAATRRRITVMGA